METEDFKDIEYVKDIEYNGITYGLLEDDSIINKDNSEKVGILNKDNEIEMYTETDFFEITGKIIYNDIFDKIFNIDDLFIIAFEKDIILTRIESIDIDRKKILLSNDEIVKELDINDDNHILLVTDDYNILDIEKIVEAEEKILEDHQIKLAKDVIKDILIEEVITNDNIYTDNEKKEELLSELIYILNANGNDKLLREITEMCERFINLSKESLTKIIENNEYLDFVKDIINEDKINFPNHIKPIVSSKRKIYVETSVLSGENIDSSILVDNIESEIQDLVTTLDSESIKNLNYKSHLDIDLNEKYNNNSLNTENKKYILPYEGEYFRDCVFGNSCIGAKVDLTKKFNKVETGSFLQTNYSYDNIRTRKQLIYPKLDSDKTVFEILKDKEKINLVGIIFFPSMYNFKNLNLSDLKYKLSLKEISDLHDKCYSYEIFKQRISRELTLSKDIGDEDFLNQVDDYNDKLTFYFFKNQMNTEELGDILKNNLPTKKDIIDKLKNINEIFDMENFSKSLHTFNIGLGDLDTGLKEEIIKKVEDNINKYVKKYKSIAKPKKVELLKVNNIKLTNEERSKLSLKYILKMINLKQRNYYLQKYIDTFLRYPETGENKNYLYNKFTNEKTLCKHYLYLIKEDKFDEMLNIYSDSNTKDGYICCKNCGEYICPEGFSPLQGFSDGKPIQTNETLINDEDLVELNKEQERNKKMLGIFEKIFNVKLNSKDLSSILDIFDTIDNKVLIQQRYKNMDPFNEHPIYKKIKEKYSLKGIKDKKEKQKIKANKKKEEIIFNRFLKESNKILVSVLLLLIFVQTSIPPYVMKVKLNILNIDADFSNITQQIINQRMMNYIEKILINYNSISKITNEQKKNTQDTIKLLIEDTKLGLNNIYNHFYDTFNYLKDNNLIVKRIKKYSEYILETGDVIYLKEYWSTFKPDKNSLLIKNINEITNLDKTLISTDKSYENNSLITEINNLSLQEKYETLKIPISEFMINESYKRLNKYVNQLHGKSTRSIKMINLLVNRLISTLKDKSIETLFKSIGWKNDTGFTSFIVNDLKRVVLQEIPNIYKDKDETTINTLLYINENNFDLKILSNKTNAKIEYYIPVNIFPIIEYEQLKENKSGLLTKIFSLYCLDNYGNIIKKKDTDYLNYLLLDADETVEIGNNCHETLKDNKGNFLLYLETLRKNVLPLKDFYIYRPFYETEIIQGIYTNNLLNFNPMNKLAIFVKNNNYTVNRDTEYTENFLKFLDIYEDMNKEENINNKLLYSKLLDAISDISSGLIENYDNFSRNIEERLDKFISENGEILQIRRLEKYYNLKLSVGKSNQQVKGVKSKTISKNIMKNINKILLDDNNDIKINFIKNIVSTIGKLNTKISKLTSNISSFWKITEERKDDLIQYFKNNNNLIHEDIFNNTSGYTGFNNYRGRNENFIELFNYIYKYDKDINLLVGIDNENSILYQRNIKILINFVFLHLLFKITQYIEELDESEDSKIEDCSRLFIDILQNIVEEYFDVSYIHENRKMDQFNKELSKQKEREKQFLLNELTSQTNEQRLLTLEKQKAGLSNWFDNLSKKNEEYKNSEQYKTDNAEERLKRLSENQSEYITEEDIMNQQGIKLEDIMDTPQDVTTEDLGYDDGKDPLDVDDDYADDDGDNLDGYDN